ncbi:MAG: efflux RND transporter periplasmic adaptor subunit [Lentisphaeria bacterium]|nr:efflux RND transporter periplasmic adaptor subunit [Candidatus Neomarinimicrobiota bacterium]MCF7841676.1 efflux RND transporter periplasmic adaptor subunit [Lentisphaeria bacterium]
MKKKKIIWIVLGLILVLATGAFLTKKDSSDNGYDYTTVSVERGSIVEKALAVGTITPRNEIQVKSKIPGIVKRMMVEVGDPVQVGEVLVDITPDPTPLEVTEVRRNLQLAQIAFDNAAKQYSRQKDLLDKQLIAPSDFEKTELAYKEAKLRLALNQDRLSLIQDGQAGMDGDKVESVVRAPTSGIVLEKFVNLGDPVVPLTTYQAGTPLFTLADMSELVFKGTVDEIDVGKVNLGMPASLKIGALPGTIVHGVVSRISPKARIQENATLFDIEIDIMPSDSVTLRAGYSANADIIIRQAQDVLIIPERLLTFADDSVFVEVEDTTSKTISRRAIEIGMSDGVQAEIVEGLLENEQVVERPPKVIQ